MSATALPGRARRAPRRRLFALVAAALVLTGGAGVAAHEAATRSDASCTYHWVYTYGYRGWDYYWLCVDDVGGGGGGSW